MPPKKYVAPRAAAGDSTQPKKRKPRVPMARPPGVSNAEWRADVQRPEAVTADRRSRLIIKRARDTAAAVLEQGEASHAGMNLPPSHCAQVAWGSQQSVASPANLPPPPPQWGHIPFPGYSDGDAHGSFDPNITFPHGALPRASPSGLNPDQRTPSPAFTAGLPTQYSYSPAAYSASPRPPLRRGTLPFPHGSTPQFGDTDADMDEVMTSGSVAAASCPGFHVQDETRDTIDMDNELNDIEEVEQEEHAEEEAEPAPVKKGRKKWAANARSGEPPRQVDVHGRRVPRRSMEDRQHQPDHRLESERRHVLEKDQDGVR